MDDDNHLEVEIYDPEDANETNPELQEPPREGKRAKRKAVENFKFTYEELSNYFGMPFQSS
jgi:hypothetical protein